MLTPSSRLPRAVAIVAALAATWCALIGLPAPTVATPGVDASAASGEVTATTISSSAGTRTKQRRDVRRTRPLYVDPESKAAAAGDAFTPIARRAQPRWITDIYATPRAARDATAAFVASAESVKQTPVIVVYNIPDRDCGLYSSNDDELTDRAYRRWVAGVARGVRGTSPLVILEPDAIAFIDDPRCTGRGDRLGLLRYATRKLTAAGAWVYLDAGHSHWRSPAHIAPLLRKAGVARARGFSTNVANVRSTRDEVAYAEEIRAHLATKGVTTRYVIDTGRNGARGARVDDYCNPLTARLGRPPRLLFDGGLDGYLWVKPPGQSDGYCNGGPAPGEWYGDGACRLLGHAHYDVGAGRCVSPTGR